MPSPRPDRSRRSAPRRQRVWMQMAVPADVELLRRRLSAKGALWSEWEYKLIGGRIIIYSPVIPWNEQHRPDPSRRYMAMHLRIVPAVPGPFQLEYRRHTEQWWPLSACPPGTMEKIAAFIDQDPTGWCRPIGQDEWEREHPQK